MFIYLLRDCEQTFPSRVCMSRAWQHNPMPYTSKWKNSMLNPSSRLKLFRLLVLPRLLEFCPPLAERLGEVRTSERSCSPQPRLRA